MAVDVLAKVGEQDLQRGHLAPLSLNYFGHFVTQNSLAAAVGRGRVFASANQTAVTTQAGLGTAPTSIVLANPAGSGVTGRLWYASAGELVAAAAAATIWLCAGSNTVGATVTGTITSAHRCLKLGGITPASHGNRIVSLVVATLPEAPVVIDILGVQVTGAITTLPALPAFSRCYFGGVLIQPGTNLSIQSSTALTGFFTSFIWEECDLIS